MKTRNIVLLVVLGASLLMALIVLAITVPQLGPARMAASEIAAVHEIRTMHAAQVQYFSMYGKYAALLAELGPPVSGPAGPQAADLISKSLASGEKDGYAFTLTATLKGYIINANPKVYNSTGRRTFYSDDTLAIHQNWSQEPANATSPELK